MDRIVPLSAAGRHGPRALIDLLAAGSETSVGKNLSSISDAIIAASRDAFLVMTQKGEVVGINPLAERLFGRDRADLIGRHILEIIRLPNAPFQPDSNIKMVDYLLLGQVDRPDNRATPVEVSLLSLEDHGSELIAAQLKDISTHSEIETELQRLAYCDPTTGLPNRYSTLGHINDMMLSGALFTVLHFNLDRFRVLKNSLGHSFADRVLVAISERVKSIIHSDAMLSRLGNDEFVIVTRALNVDETRLLANRIQAVLSRDLIIDGRDIHLTASIGVVASNPSYNGPAEILSDAEIAAFQAKINGGSTFAVFDQPMREVLMDLQQTEADLRLAVQGGTQLWVAYQPIVDLKRGTLAGFEALVRWNHPERGKISPIEFISIAEATGLIVPLGAEILAQSCRELERWTKIFGAEAIPFMSVNLSLRQLAETNFIDYIRHVIAETGIKPGKLKLEITETMLMTNPEESIRKLQEVKSLGVELSIDDFGTGYSSLAYLHRLPVKNLKIDQSFVKRIAQPNNREIVRIITELAGILGLTVIAEGVETIEDVGILQSLGCGYGQGYFFSKPLDTNDAEKYIGNKVPLPWSSKGLFGS